ncbi:Retinol dehydrogenase 7 [Aphelenchoides bicaudatus]|nr:Retinol dehydrogenase 7 [Aphelenchoides bicaudatus]
MFDCLCHCSWLGFALISLIGYFVVRYLLECLVLSDLEQKAVFISGCDTGFGRQAALKLAQKGCPVFAGCLTKEGITSIENESKGLRGRVIGVPLNILEDESVREAANFVEKNLPPGTKLWALLNNAGVFSTFGPSEWCEISEYKLAMDLNFYGAVRCTHAFMPLIKKSKGRIGATTSVSGRLATPCATPYSSAKFALSSYIEAISTEMFDYNIKFAIFEPGIFKTNLLDRTAKNKRVDFVWNKMSASLREEYGEEYKQKFLDHWHKTMDEVGSSNTNHVVDAYVHFVISKFPRFRYKCGWDSILFWCPASCLPDQLDPIYMDSKQQVQSSSYHKE